MNYLDKPKLVAKVSMSMSTINRLEKADDFPKRFVLVSKKVVWDEDEVDQWMRDMKEQSRALNIQPSTKPDVKLRWAQTSTSSR